MIITTEYVLLAKTHLDRHVAEHNCIPAECDTCQALWREVQEASDNWGRNVELALAA